MNEINPFVSQLEQFVGVFGKDERKGFDFESCSFSKKAVSVNYPSDLSSSEELLTLYRHLVFNESMAVGGSFYLSFSSLEKLKNSQMGWRWTINDDDSINENCSWNSSHVVIANRHGDALIADTSEAATPILGRLPAGEAFEVADSMSLFFAVLTQCMICESEEFNMDTTEEDDEVESEEFIKKVNVIAAKLLSPKAAEGFVYYFFG